VSTIRIIADAIRARLGELQAQGLVTEQQVNQIIDAYSAQALDGMRVQMYLQLGPIRLARRARRRELRRYIRQQASERRLRRNRAVIDETHLWRGRWLVTTVDHHNGSTP